MGPSVVERGSSKAVKELLDILLYLGGLGGWKMATTIYTPHERHPRRLLWQAQQPLPTGLPHLTSLA